MSRLCCHPLDTVKARLQASENVAFRGILGTLSSTFRKEGLVGLYRGIGATVVGGAPAMALYMTSYEASKATMLAMPSVQAFPAAAHLCSGMVAEAVSCVVFVPVDVVKERLQVQGTSATSARYAGEPYANSFDALRRIVATEGLGGIYKGYGATLLSFGPFSALYFLFYERLKASLLEMRGTPGGDIRFGDGLVAASAAGGMAGWLTSPLDLAKLRYQLQRGAARGDAGAYGGMFDGLRKIYRAEGFRGFWRGSAARVLFFAPSTAVSMTAMEQIKQLLQPAVRR